MTKKNVYPAAVYGFLEFIRQYERTTDTNLGRKILDCAAGGRRPPLGFFHEHGFETCGIDISQKQISAAEEFSKTHGMQIRISKGDMRNITFENESFDFVYEYYSMCHLTKEDTRRAISEMTRVLRSGGLLFLGFISHDTWPIDGEEKGAGEFWLYEHGDEEVVHSFFDDHEAEEYLSGLEILSKVKKAMSHRWWMFQVSKEEWMNRHADNWTLYSKEDWEKMYDSRISKQKYTHIFYILKKP